MTATDGTETYVCTNTVMAVESGFNYQCQLVLGLGDETGVSSANIFPASLITLNEPGATFFNSRLFFQNGVVSLDQSNGVSVLWTVVPAAGNPAWPGVSGLPWTGDFAIRDSADVLTGDTITVTIEELPG